MHIIIGVAHNDHLPILLLLYAEKYTTTCARRLLY